ncbi:cache domain-containing protein [Roseobacter sp. YSTF-M11]|uniref:Cache domain-containing protein n=1 Tax=Roseobacter insulae TaxID=2859783 RepID=A0A9X1FV92_9RHOB|nr:cache domain-containing protein [Roseobacter insulae]MBW4708236.1 cache domain-containing protein [Roseobacter insulae]
MIRTFLLSSPLMIAASVAYAVDAPPAMKAFVETDIMNWAQSAEVTNAIIAQNAETAGASITQIEEWDTAWRAQVGQATQPLIDEVMGRPLSATLKEQVAESGGRITEIFVMDALGLNVAASGVTSDYWQGDEDKYAKSYGVGAGAVFVDEVEFDESSQTYQGQVSFTITDPSSGEIIGAMTVGLNAEAFF